MTRTCSKADARVDVVDSDGAARSPGRGGERPSWWISPAPPPPASRRAGTSPALGRRETELLRAVARIALPGSDALPRAGAWSAARVDDFLATLPAGVRALLRGILWGIEAHALARHLRSFTRLGAAEQAALLERWHRGDAVRRIALRALLTPLKIAHFNAPSLYAQLGCTFRRPAPAAAPRRAAGIVPARELGGTALECDVVVVGSGAGGAVVAAELADRGLAVVLLEEGEHVTRHELTGHGLGLQRRLYRDLGATFAIGNTALLVPLGRAVGGSTTVNSGTCFRAPERVLRSWSDQLGLSDLAPDRLAPYYERVEAVLGVAPAADRHLGGVARVIARGCEALGWRHGPLLRNAPDCDGRGTCVFGCPTDAKRSTNVSYVPRALRRGARLVTGARVDRILASCGRAAGVGAGRLEVRARATVLACGALLTPVLLERAGLGRASGQLGRNLSLHPSAAVGALFDEPIRGWDAIPQGYAIHEFLDQGLLFEGAFMPPDLGAATLPLFGPRLAEIIASYDRFACFGFLVEDTSRGRVRAGPGGRPLVTYRIGEADVAQLARGVELLARCYFAAGARSVFPLVAGFDELRGPADLERLRATRLRARDFDLTAYHPLGTCRMGVDPARSVVSPGHELHDLPGLYVVDGSAVPTALGVNPQLTIMALATRAADLLSVRL